MAPLTEQVIRRVLAEEYRTRLALKVAWANAYLAAIQEHGDRRTTISQNIAIQETAEMQQAYDTAYIEGQIVRWLMRQHTDDGE